MAASSLDKEFNGNGGNKEAARKVGEMIAKRAAEKGISQVVLTAAVIFPRPRQKSWPKAPARAASSSKKEGYFG